MPSRSDSPDKDPTFSSTSTDDLGLPSPPYRRVASHSHLRFDIFDNHPEHENHPTPAYSSRIDLGMSKEKEPHTDDESPVDADNLKGTAKTVHYPETLQRGPVQGFYHVREDSTDLLSRPASIAGTEDEYEDEDYDWSGEDDLVDAEAAYQQKMGNKPASKKWGLKRFITFLFSSLIGSTLLAGVLVAPALLVHFYWYKPHPTDARRYIKQNVQAWLFWAAANLLLSWYLALIVDLVPIVATYIISGAWGHVSEAVRSRVEMYNSVKNTIKPLFYAASAWASWHIIFANIYRLYDDDDTHQSRAPYTRRLQQVIAFLFFFTLVICAQRMLSHAIAFSFHRTAYQERIDSVNTALSVIETLRDYRPKPSSAPRSGGRTPIFGALNMGSLGLGGLGLPVRSPGTPGGGVVNEKDHYQFLKGALKRHKRGQSRSNTGDTAETAESRGARAYDGDTEEWGDNDGDRTAVGTASRSTHKKGKSREGTVVDDLEMRPTTPSGLRNAIPPPLTVTEASPQHQYPPTRSRPSSGYFSGISPMSNSPRHSIDGSHSGGGSRVEAVGEAVGEAVEAVAGAAEAAAKVLKAAALHDARNIRGKSDQEGGGVEALTWNVSSSREAKRLARAIYHRFKDRRRNYLLPSDFYPAFPSTDAAEAAFRVFDKDNNGDISRAEIKSTLVKVYKERRFLSRSMRDVGAALTTLDHILLFFALVVLFFISLSVFGVEVGDSLTSVYSLGIAASFIFKNAASSAFDAIMFLFVTHPFDTGDRVFIDDENMIVKKMGLFATEFTRSDGTQTYYFNSQLFSKLM
ncbi:hypothetical protein HGRIS_009085 [Hohenbuehelia grisea]|uniref:EF-hand domain-containing protein n=1 Tax=Hohenbuehelia grisea TaxID=104357 RepID=A0ABR3J0I1_9AGAR